jgi:pseudaminic acid biosynthesis-associated methylase
MTTYNTDQEEFWAGDFGSLYPSRNSRDRLLATNLNFFSNVLASAPGISSSLEIGANIGINLEAMHQLLPHAALHGLEINPDAHSELAKHEFVVPHLGSILTFESEDVFDLVFTKGVLIHINPDSLPRVYQSMASLSKRYVLIAEYYNPTPVSIPYRGHDDRLFKRDFAAEFQSAHPNFHLMKYGFCYHADPVFPQDDITWFLLERGDAI